MLNIRVVCVGRLKERFWADAQAEFLKRLGRYAKVEVVEVADEKAPEALSAAQREQVKLAEGRRMLKALSGHVVALDLAGGQLSSPGLARQLGELQLAGASRLSFAIGGSLGLSAEVLQRADTVLSFSAMTFSHQLFRIMLLEQLYRAFKISANEPYHK